MPRPPRIHVPGGFYHAMLRGNHREDIFDVDSDRHLLNTIVRTALMHHGARVHGYCWMTNHLHLLVQIGTDPLANLMRRIASGYARAFQANRETTGHLFEKRYLATLVDHDSYLLELLRYIHRNPVDARLAKDVAQYRWSSHHVYAGRNLDSWVTTDFALRMFSQDGGRARAAYLQFVRCETPQLTSLPDFERDSPAILGGDDFIARVTGAATKPKSRIKLDELVTEACARFGLREDQITSSMRNPRVAAARAWIARRATSERIATLTAVARRLGCDTNTLRYAMRRFAQDDEVATPPGS